MSFKDTIKKVLKKVKNTFIKTDAFREHCEDELAKVLNDMSNYTALDDVKATLIASAINIAISYTPVIGGVTVALTAAQVKTLSEQVVLYGHKAEKLIAKQLEK